MKSIITFIFSIFLHSYALCQSKDSLQLKNIEYKIEKLENGIEEIRRDQLNYRLEKDLLKETYSNNYERISLFITIGLAVIGLIGYKGMRDISSIKKEYDAELSNLRQVQGSFNTKVSELDTEKRKFDEDLKNLIKENEDQNRKIKFIELKDKVRSYLKEDQFIPALEFTNAALQIQESDYELLNTKGAILCCLNQLSEALEIFSFALQLHPDNSTTILNTVECLYFAKDFEKAEDLINKHKILFDKKDNGKLLQLLDLIKMFHLDRAEELLDIAKKHVNFDNMNVKSKFITDWNLREAKYFIYYQPESEVKTMFQNIIWYWDGSITGEMLLTKLGLDLPVNPN